MTGGTHVVSTALTVLSADTSPCRQITLTLNVGGGSLWLHLEDGTKIGHLIASGSVTIGPFDMSLAVKPSDIYVTGTANNELYWLGVKA